MEAKYENSTLQRLEVLNRMVEMAQNFGFNLYEKPKSIKVIVERQDGTTITEQLKSEEIETVVEQYMTEKNQLPPFTLTQEMFDALKEYFTNLKN